MRCNIFAAQVALLALSTLHNNSRRRFVSARDITETQRLQLSDLDYVRHNGSSKRVHPQLSWSGPQPDPMNDEDWERYKCKGTKLLAQMSWSDFDVGQALPVLKDTAQSEYFVQDLQKWGYSLSEAAEEYEDLQEGGYWGVAPYLRAAGFSDKCMDDGGNWHMSAITHFDPEDGETRGLDTWYQSPEGLRRKTGAYFVIAVSPDGGILAQNRVGPRESAKEVYEGKEPPFLDSELPKLQKSSDMMYALWEHWIPNDQLDNLDFFFALSITNKVTLAILSRAMNNRGAKLSKDGTLFQGKSPEGKAIIASPNGTGFAHLLIQRKKFVGLKTIQYVWVYECPSMSKAPCILFITEDLDAPTPREPQPPGPPAPQVPDPNGGSKPTTMHRDTGHDNNLLRVHTVVVGA